MVDIREMAFYGSATGMALAIQTLTRHRLSQQQYASLTLLTIGAGYSFWIINQHNQGKGDARTGILGFWTIAGIGLGVQAWIAWAEAEIAEVDQRAFMAGMIAQGRGCDLATQQVQHHTRAARNSAGTDQPDRRSTGTAGEKTGDR